MLIRAVENNKIFLVLEAWQNFVYMYIKIIYPSCVFPVS